jgi:hypothetical protein
MRIKNNFDSSLKSKAITPFIRLTLFINKGSKSIKCSRLSYKILYYKAITTVVTHFYFCLTKYKGLRI